MSKLDYPPLILVIVGPRQVGKTTAAQRLVERLGWPYVAASADAPLPPGPEWIETQWQRARMPSMISKSTRARIVSQRYSSSESVPSV